MKIYSQKANTETIVSNIFIDKYMKNANGEFVKVYLYLLKCFQSDSTQITQKDIADSLNLMESDVVRALRYWDRENVIKAEFDDSCDTAIAITLMTLDATQPAIISNTTTLEAPTVQTVSLVNEEKKREETRQLFYIIEKYIGKQLNSSDAQRIMYMLEELHFSTELVEYLVEYCVSNSHSSTRYMETVANSWHESGITTVEEAKSSTILYSRKTVPVMKAFGFSDRKLTPAELDFINRWYDDYAFDRVIIEEACKRTVLTMGKPNFSYADGILRKWQTAGVHTMDDIKKLDAGFRGKVTVPVSTKSNNQFNNFSQRTYDFDQLEKAANKKN